MRSFSFLPRLFFTQRQGGRLLRQRGHNIVVRVIRKQAIDGQFLFEVSALRQRGIVVEVYRITLVRVILDPSVQPENFSRRSEFGLVDKAVANRSEGS